MSISHASLVNLIIEYVELATPDGQTFIFADDPAICLERPKKIGMSIPDVHAKNLKTKFELIGEAKPGYDLVSSRTEKQFEDYFDYLFRNNDAVFAIATEVGSIDLAKKIIYPIKIRLCIADERIVYLS